MRTNYRMVTKVEASRHLLGGVDLGPGEALPAGGSGRAQATGDPAAFQPAVCPGVEVRAAGVVAGERPYEPVSVLTLYMQEIGRVGLLTRQEEAELARRVQGGDGAAREQMIKANLRLVVKIARDFEHMGVPLLDLISEGNIGLMKAVERYDPNKGAKLSVYASFWIKQHMRRAIQEHGRTIRLPAYCQERLQAINLAALRLRELLGRDPTDEEIAFEVGLAAGKVRKAREAAQATVSLEEPLHGTDSLDLADTMADDNAVSPYETLAQSVALDQLHDLMEELSPRQKAVLRARFGLGGERERSLQEIGQEVGLTRERVRQIQNSALEKLRLLICQRELDCLPA
jgi:RNA polymerase primary sigma factor